MGGVTLFLPHKDVFDEFRGLLVCLLDHVSIYVFRRTGLRVAEAGRDCPNVGAVENQKAGLRVPESVAVQMRQAVFLFEPFPKHRSLSG